MAVTVKATPQLKAMYALRMARNYRHHRDCRCGMYHGEDCTAASALWAAAMNRELELILSGKSCG
jgi:hypothetical protein